METKKQFITRLVKLAVLCIILIVFVAYSEDNKTQRQVIYPEEWSEAKTGDSLIIIYADEHKIEIGFDNAKNR
jgi:hypothetical protein